MTSTRPDKVRGQQLLTAQGGMCIYCTILYTDMTEHSPKENDARGRDSNNKRIRGDVPGVVMSAVMLLSANSKVTSATTRIYLRMRLGNLRALREERGMWSP